MFSMRANATMPMRATHRPPAASRTSRFASPSVSSVVTSRSASTCACGGHCPRCESQAQAHVRSDLVGGDSEAEKAPEPTPTPSPETDSAATTVADSETSAVPTANTGCPPVPAPGFTPIVTPTDNFTGRSLTKAGIGETFDLSFSSVVSSDPAFFGGLRWSKESGGGTLVTTDLGVGNWTAPKTNDKTKLSIRAGTAQQCVMATVEIESVEPKGLVMNRPGNNHYKDRQGKWGTGALLQPVVQPKDVSFSAIQVKEDDAVVQGTGWLSFKTGLHHCKGSGSGFFSGTNGCGLHRVVAKPSIGSVPAGGCDMASTGGNTGIKDDAPFGTDAPYDAGAFNWDIPWSYVIGTEPPKQFAIARVDVTSDAAGGATMTKAGSPVVSAGLNDAASPWNFSVCK